MANKTDIEDQAQDDSIDADSSSGYDIGKLDVINDGSIDEYDEVEFEDEDDSDEASSGANKIKNLEDDSDDAASDDWALKAAEEYDKPENDGWAYD